MNWTNSTNLRGQVKKLWDRGAILANIAGGSPIFPRRLSLKGPTSAELGERFVEVRDWISELDHGAKQYRVVRRTINHRVLGANSVPVEVWIDTLECALALIGKAREADRFTEIVAMTAKREPGLVKWLEKRPLRALELMNKWPRLLAIVAWLKHHPRPGIYLRQVDIPGVHSKFLEFHRTVLAELFDLVLPPGAIDDSANGGSGFCRRYGFRDKPLRLRVRILDPDLAPLATGTDQDITITHDTFARLDPPVAQVFITENEINFLAFPPVPRSMVIFGAGYGFEILADAKWLHSCSIHYWGDIDTHGFAILDQLRALFPSASSLLMDRDTLLTHRTLWGKEPHPKTRDLPRLTSEESILYDDLRCNRLSEHLRLEQERIGFDWTEKALARLPQGDTNDN